MSVMALSFGLLWTYISAPPGEARGDDLATTRSAGRSRVFAVVTPVYAVTIAVAFVSGEAVLVINAALALYYAVAGIRRQGR